MLTRNFVHYVVLVVLGVGVLSTGAQMSSADASDDYWVQGRGIDTEDGEKQQALLTALMAEFKRFDQLYEKRQAGQEITAQQWLDMAQRFEAFEGHEITSDRTGISPHLLRAQLLQGQADLLASMVLYHKGASDEEFFGAYHRGLDTLETLLRLVNDDIDYLPRYSFMYKPDSQKTWEVRVNPYAGYETIGTGVVYSGPDNRRLDAPQRVTQYDYEGYKSLEVYAGYVEAELNEIGATLRTDIQSGLDEPHEPYRRIQQVHTSSAARRWLTDFCPWGVRVYRLMQAQGWIARPQLQILRPFGTQTTELSELQMILHAVGARTVEMLTEKPLFENIPIHVDKEMRQLIGSGQTMPSPGQGKLKWLKDAQGVLGTGSQSRPIRWRMVQADPTYTAWFYSPACFDMKTSEKLGWALKAVKLYFGGVAAVVEDELTDVFVTFVEGMAGKDGVLYATSYLAAEQDNWGVPLLFDTDTTLLDKSGKPLKQLTKLAFGAMEEKEIEWLYENIDPEKFVSGVSYDGTSSVPPVVLRGEVFGFEQLKPYQYQKNHRIVYYYRLLPGHLASSYADVNYDLSEELYPTLHWQSAYLQRQENIHQWVWPAIANPRDRQGRVLDPLGKRDYVTDYAPVAQIVEVHFDRGSFHQWQKHSGSSTRLTVGLYSPLAPDRLIQSVDLRDAVAVIQVLNQDCWVTAGTLNQPKYDFPIYLHPRVSHRPQQKELFTEYVLKIKDHAEELEQIRLVFVNSPEQRVTGEVTYPYPGYAQLTYKQIPTDPRLNRFKKCQINFAEFGCTITRNGKPFKQPVGSYGGPDFYFEVEGSFKGNVFEGTRIQGKPEDESQGVVRVRITVEPETLKVLSFEASDDFFEPRCRHKKVLHGKDIPMTEISDSVYTCSVKGETIVTENITSIEHTVDRVNHYNQNPNEHETISDVTCNEYNQISIRLVP